jgi:hypothetical protein
MNKATEKQINFINELLANAPQQAKEKANFLLEQGVETFTTRDASYCINILLKYSKGSEQKTAVQKPKAAKVEYFKNLLDYITIEEYKDFLQQYAKENLHKSWTYRHGYFKTNDEALQIYTKELFDNLEHSMQYDSFGDISYYIRETIIHKSLGLTLEDKIDLNGDGIYYAAIWDKLPIIEGLEVTDEAYTASWGYDQTNIDIAYRLNKKVWGLDVLKCNTSYSYYLVRIKDTSKPNNYFAFSDKNGVRNFRRDLKPLKTFEMDASQTGQYR